MAGINSKPHENENLGARDTNQMISILKNYSSENSKGSITFYIERKNVVKTDVTPSQIRLTLAQMPNCSGLSSAMSVLGWNMQFLSLAGTGLSEE